MEVRVCGYRHVFGDKDIRIDSVGVAAHYKIFSRMCRAVRDVHIARTKNAAVVLRRKRMGGREINRASLWRTGENLSHSQSAPAL